MTLTPEERADAKAAAERLLECQREGRHWAKTIVPDGYKVAAALLSILPEIERMERIEAAAEEYCNVACDMNNFICRHHGIADGELYLEFLRLDDAQAIAKEKLREALTPTGATELLHTESDHERDEATPD